MAKITMTLYCSVSFDIAHFINSLAVGPRSILKVPTINFLISLQKYPQHNILMEELIQFYTSLPFYDLCSTLILFVQSAKRWRPCKYLE